jgi:hypothetical protein
MVRVRSTTQYVGGTATGGSDDEGRGSEERMASVQLSDAGSHNEAGDVTNEGAHS